MLNDNRLRLGLTVTLPQTSLNLLLKNKKFRWLKFLGRKTHTASGSAAVDVGCLVIDLLHRSSL